MNNYIGLLIFIIFVVYDNYNRYYFKNRRDIIEYHIETDFSNIDLSLFDKYENYRNCEYSENDLQALYIIKENIKLNEIKKVLINTYLKQVITIENLNYNMDKTIGEIVSDYKIKLKDINKLKENLIYHNYKDIYDNLDDYEKDYMLCI